MSEIVPTTAGPYDKTAVTMQGVDTIIAMPQWYVNFNLASLLKNGTTTNGQSLREVKLTYANGTSWLVGVIERLWTKVYVEGQSPRSCSSCSSRAAPWSTGT